MNPEGRLTIDLHRNGAGVERASINSSRPLHIASMFEGRAINEVLTMVPILFNVCGMAQGCAAVTACEKAAGLSESKKVASGRSLVVLCENTREHLLRILLEWPRFVDDQFQTSNVKRVMALPTAMQGALFARDKIFTLSPCLQFEPSKVQTVIAGLVDDLNRYVFGEDIEKWRNRTSWSDLQEWLISSQTLPARLISKVVANDWARAGGVLPTFLPSMDSETLESRLTEDDADEFIAQPTWNQKTCETSALSRQADTPLIKSLLSTFGASLLTRQVARLVELSRIPIAMQTLFEQILVGKNKERSCNEECKRGHGLHQVEAARGRLVHSVKIEDGRIARYRILAPTEWNFHKSGPTKSSLENLSAGTEDELKAQADLLITAMDPCVGYELRIH